MTYRFFDIFYRYCLFILKFLHSSTFNNLFSQCRFIKINGQGCCMAKSSPKPANCQKWLGTCLFFRFIQHGSGFTPLLTALAVTNFVAYSNKFVYIKVGPFFAFVSPIKLLAMFESSSKSTIKYRTIWKWLSSKPFGLSRFCISIQVSILEYNLRHTHLPMPIIFRVSHDYKTWNNFQANVKLTYSMYKV